MLVRVGGEVGVPIAGTTDERVEDRMVFPCAVPREALDVDPAKRVAVGSHQRMFGFLQDNHDTIVFSSHPKTNLSEREFTRRSVSKDVEDFIPSLVVSHCHLDPMRPLVASLGRDDRGFDPLR
jgi:hypothetical protein